MKTLILVRHAKSEQKNYKGKERNRPITKKGERYTRRLVEHLKSREIIPQMIVSSPVKRASQTAEIIKEQGEFGGKIKYRDGLYMTEADELVKVIQKLPKKVDCVLIVGHNPGLESLIPLMTHEIIALPHAGMAYISIPVEQWKEINRDTCAQLVDSWNPGESAEPKVPVEPLAETPAPEVQ
ncbi:MAG: histidine phosphatase family protein [Anaerolineaceae bacterium]|nr:histidine phosphatase family protein [Anaerolineaceae bacterium]